MFLCGRDCKPGVHLTQVVQLLGVFVNTGLILNRVAKKAGTIQGYKQILTYALHMYTGVM